MRKGQPVTMQFQKDDGIKTWPCEILKVFGPKNIAVMSRGSEYGFDGPHSQWKLSKRYGWVPYDHDARKPSVYTLTID